MSKAIFGKYIPANVPGASLTPKDMAQVLPEDWQEVQKLARGYCRTVDATRSRKRMDGSGTIVRNGWAPYGTDDVSDDVTQDAVLLFAQRLRDVIAKCAVAPESGSTPDTRVWIYVRKDGAQFPITRTTLRRWAVRDAASRNGYRLDVAPDAQDTTPGEQTTKALAHAESVATAALYAPPLAQNSAAIFRTAFGDGSDFPTIKHVIEEGERATDLGRGGILATAARKIYGGAYGSRRNVIRTRDAARNEWRELAERCDHARDALIYQGAREA